MQFKDLVCHYICWSLQGVQLPFQPVSYTHLVEKILVNNKNINYCLGCRACKLNKGICIHKDDMTEILDKIISSNIIVFASPVYFYSFNAQMKAIMDRTYAKLESCLLYTSRCV